jgi:type 1 fimbria pilin
MRNLLLFLPLLASAATPVVAADGGVVRFSGAILEPTCPVRDTAPACERAASVEMTARPTASLTHVPLFAYALARDPATRWRVLEVVYR